jgi:hypothetical protein
VKRQFAAFFMACWCASLAGCVESAGVKPVDVPASLAPPAGQVLTQQLHATGVQIYQCQGAKNDPTRFEWSFVQPEATLSTQKGKIIGKHYAGPTWAAADGSKVMGEVIARNNSPDPNSIPWLLLRATTTSGKGIFTGVKSIQRLHTMGGAAPAGGCGQSQAGQQQRVPYSADYLFYG